MRKNELLIGVLFIKSQNIKKIMIKGYIKEVHSLYINTLFNVLSVDTLSSLYVKF